MALKFLLQNQSIRQTVIKNTFWLTLSQAVGRLLRAALVIYATRLLGASSWGVFSYTLGISGLLLIFSDVGLAGFLTREISRNPEGRQSYIATSFGIRMMLLGLGIVVFLALAPTLSVNREVLAIFPLILVLTALDSLRDLTIALARAMEKMELEAGINIVTNLVILALGFGFLVARPTALSLATAYTIGSGIGLAVSIVVLRRYLTGLWKHFSRTLIRPILSQAWPLGLMGMMGALMINTDMIMIGLLRTIEEVGFYSAAQKPILLLYILPGLLAVPLFPVMSRLASERDRLRMILSKSLRLVTLAALPLVLGGVLLGKEIVELLYGEAYLEAATTFKILSLTLVTTFPAMLLGIVLFTLEERRRLIAYTVLSVGGNFILNLILIPPYGMVGSAWSTVITQLVGTAFVWASMRSLIGHELFGSLWRLPFALLVMGAFLFITQPWAIPVVVSVVIAGGLYGATLIMLKEPMLAEIRSLVR